MKSRAIRRHHLARIKMKVAHYYGGWMKSYPQSGKAIGKAARAKAPCSCWMCGNPRKFSNQETLQEWRNEYGARSAMRDL
jgi:hypothetical protein